MKKYFFFLLLVNSFCFAQSSLLQEQLDLELSTYEKDKVTKASAMPVLKVNSEFMPYKRRFEYLLINVSAMHSPDKLKERNAIWELYPDTVELKRLYLLKFTEDKKLAKYFEETAKCIKDAAAARKYTYTQEDLMEVASKFFYCDKIRPDTAIIAHICVGLNGVKEAKWEKDYILLQAFCYEAIFTQFDSDTSWIWDAFTEEKKQAVDKYKKNITSLEQYLQDVKLELFKRMKNNVTLKQELLLYYEKNKNNLAFTLTK